MTKAPQLTDRECEAVILALARGATRNGYTNGVPEEVLNKAFKQISSEVVAARIQLAALHAFVTEQLDVWVDDDGKQTWYARGAGEPE